MPCSPVSASKELFWREWLNFSWRCAVVIGDHGAELVSKSKVLGKGLLQVILSGIRSLAPTLASADSVLATKAAFRPTLL